MSQLLDCALDLMRRLPPSQTERNLANILELVPDLTEDLLSAVDQPLKSATCSKTGKEFLLCDYNRDGDSYRSPWSNEYQPPLEDGNKPSSKLQKLELFANEAFDTFRELYYEGGVSSVYLWDLDDGFAVNDETAKARGSWDSIHVFEIHEKGKMARYRVTSTVLLQIITHEDGKVASVDLSGSLTRQAESEAPLDLPNSHIVNMGRIVEDMETKIRGALQDIYFGKTKDIVNDLRSIQDLTAVKKQQAMQAALLGRLADRNTKA